MRSFQTACARPMSTALTLILLGAGCLADESTSPPDPQSVAAEPDAGAEEDASSVEFPDTDVDPSEKVDAGEHASEDAEVTPDTDAEKPACGCPIGDGPYCGRRAKGLAADADCELDPLVTTNSTLYGCEDGSWTELEVCEDRCRFDAESSDLDDRCVLPVCDCFVQVAWCGSGAAKVAAEMGCRIPLLPEHRGDILHCPGGEWAVREACDDGCIEAPTGTPDVCKTESDYLLPVPCPKVARCTNGNDTTYHTGKDRYAYDFGMPVGSEIVAMRSGTVHRVRNVSRPGDSCYGGGGSACANYANTVEIKHTDGTIGLYMHLQRGTVSVGQQIRQGDKIGVSGNSGWSTGPHLHVQVQQNCGSWWCQSVPFSFGERRNLAAGTSVTSANCGPD